MRKSLSKAVVLAGLLLLAIVLGSCTGAGSIPKAPDLLEQIYTAFETYAEEYDGKYPPMSPKPGEFVPDMDAFGPYLARLPEGDILSAYLTGKCGVQLCYLHYVLPSQRITLALLDECEKRGIAILRDLEYIELEAEGPLVRYTGGVEPRRLEGVMRSREGLRRFLGTGIGQPAGSKAPLAWAPILWEMPDTTPAAGGWVLYMDGHTEWLPYGSFPMTGKTVTRLRDFVAPPAEMTQDRAPRVDSMPPEYRWTRRRPSPVHQIAADVADSLPLACYKLTHCDVTPSVKLLRYEGYRIVIESGIEVVLFPADIEVDDEFKHRIWPRGSEERNTVVADLGVGQGYHWFARASVTLQDNFRQDFGLTGGDERLQHMIDTNAFYLMPRLGERAVPYLETVVTDEENDDFAHAIMALDQIGGTRAEELIRAAFAPDNESAFKNAREFPSRTMFGRYGYRLSDSLVDVVADAFLTWDDVDQLADIAVGCAVHSTRADTSQMNRIGLAILKRLPRDVVGRALERRRDLSRAQAERLERDLSNNEP